MGSISSIGQEGGNAMSILKHVCLCNKIRQKATRNKCMATSNKCLTSSI